MARRAVLFTVGVLMMGALAASLPGPVALAAPQPLSDPVPHVDGLTGAPDLLFAPVLGAPIPPRFEQTGERDLLQQRLHERRHEEQPPRKPRRERSVRDARDGGQTNDNRPADRS